MIRGIIFDLDGTLVDSGLDFDLMRREMGLPAGGPLLEALAALPEPRAVECREILARHEWAGAQRARLMPGVAEFLDELNRRGIHRAVLTRNCREVALATIGRLKLEFDLVVAREDAPAKPDPAAIWMVCEKWTLPRSKVVMLGDFVFDVEAGRQAGVRTVLYTAGREPSLVAGHERADFCLRSFVSPGEFFAWIESPAAKP